MAQSSKPRVFIVRASNAYLEMFKKAGFAISTQLIDSDLVCFTGGEDVSPIKYGELTHPRTHSNSTRDVAEESIYKNCCLLMLPMVGVCRGGQFLNVMNGGKMYQHVSRHCEDHFMTDVATGERIWVSSTHHQMMRPGDKATLVAIADQGGDKEHMDGDQIKSVAVREPDMEVLFYPETESLCFQPHPEFHTTKGDGYDEMHSYFFRMISEHLDIKGSK